jgi:hypothetical protein
MTLLVSRYPCTWPDSEGSSLEPRGQDLAVLAPPGALPGLAGERYQYLSLRLGRCRGYERWSGLLASRISKLTRTFAAETESPRSSKIDNAWCQ